MKSRFFAVLANTLLVVLLLMPFNTRVSRAEGGIRLHPPFSGTYRVTAFFDHEKPSYCNQADGYITIYNGERVSAYCGYSSPPWGDPYPYDGHDAWDFSMPLDTDVLAAADGVVVLSQETMEPLGILLS